MARPMKIGLPYWPRDVGFLRDKKVRMIKADFGIKGVFILECLLDAIYEEDGYFKKWDEDDSRLMAAAIGEESCPPQTIEETVAGCVRRSFFDKGVFDAFGVLTSAGIQRRYVLGASKRERISLVEEYWLLPKEEIPASVLLKCAFSNVSGERTAVSGEKTRVSVSESTQRKEKKKKVDKSKAEESSAPPGGATMPAPSDADWCSVLEAFAVSMGQEATQAERRSLAGYYHVLGNDLVLEGFQIAKLRGVCTWPYVKGILEPWREAGYTKLEQVCRKPQTYGGHPLPGGQQSPVNSERIKWELDRMDRILKEGVP